jgi:hypothetical protein
MADTHIVERTERSGSSAGMMLGIVALVLILVVAFFMFGGFGRMTGGNPGQTNVNVPSQTQPQSAPNINVPRQIDVNVNQPAPQAPQAPSGGQGR